MRSRSWSELSSERIKRNSFMAILRCREPAAKIANALITSDKLCWERFMKNSKSMVCTYQQCPLTAGTNAHADGLVFRLREIQSFKRPLDRDQGSMYQELSSENSGIDRTETYWINRSDDLVALTKDAEHSWFNVTL